MYRNAAERATAPTPAETFPPIPLGIDSLLWRFSDQRLGLTGLTAGLLQLMHPQIGAGVTQQSNFFDDPWDRVNRSVPQIMQVVFGGEDAEAAGRKVRNHHRRIHGVDHYGRPYDALDPEVFWFAHATFQHSVHQVADRFSHHELTLDEREQLYREGVEWYRRYDVDMAPVPLDHAAFATRWSHHCTNVLEMTPAAERVIDMALHSTTNVPTLPAWSKPLQRHLLTPITRLTQLGGLPSIVRDRFAIPWSRQDQLELHALEVFVRRVWFLLPDQARWGPIGVAARRRELERPAATSTDETAA